MSMVVASLRVYQGKIGCLLIQRCAIHMDFRFKKVGLANRDTRRIFLSGILFLFERRANPSEVLRGTKFDAGLHSLQASRLFKA